MSPLRTLIIEDNEAARADLRDRLSAHPQIMIIGEADSVRRARPLLARRDYDLVFLDIRLRGGTGFDLVPDIAPEAQVIFVTAHDEFALRAFEVNALDYLLKPVQPERLAASLTRLGLTESAKPDRAKSLPLSPDDVVLVRTDEGSRIIPVDEISVIRSAQNYTEILLVEGTRLMVRRSLKEWEDQLAQTNLVRAARDFMVNLRHIERTERLGERGAALWIQGIPDPLTASQRQWPVLRNRLADFRRKPS